MGDTEANKVLGEVLSSKPGACGAELESDYTEMDKAFADDFFDKPSVWSRMQLGG